MLRNFLRNLRDRKVRQEQESVLPEQHDATLADMRGHWTAERIARAVQEVRAQDLSGKQWYHVALAGAPGVGDFAEVLDFGAGSSFVTHHLARLYPDMRIQAYDLAYAVVPALFAALQGANPNPAVTYHREFEPLLAAGKLVFSNLVFSHFAPLALDHYLCLFRQSGAALAFAARSDLAQAGRGRMSVRRGGMLYCHDYQRYLEKHGYRVRWMYALDAVGMDKRTVLGFAE